MSDRYDILRLLGKGRTGGVYEAQDTVLGRKVALRRFFSVSGDTDTSSWRDSFQELTTNLCGIQHPGLMTVFDGGVDDDGAFMVTELLEGKVLEDILEDGHVSNRQFSAMAADLLDCFTMLHMQGFCHGALSGRSLMEVPRAGGRFRYKIVDLGMSALIPLINPGMPQLAWGDPALMAPELFDGHIPDARADVYMLGHLFYLSLAGGHPLAGIPADEAKEKHLAHRFAPLSGYRTSVPKEIVDWIETLTQADPNARPANAAAALSIMPTAAIKAAERNTARRGGGGGQQQAAQQQAAQQQAAQQQAAQQQAAQQQAAQQQPAPQTTQSGMGNAPAGYAGATSAYPVQDQQAAYTQQHQQVAGYGVAQQQQVYQGAAVTPATSATRPGVGGSAKVGTTRVASSSSSSSAVPVILSVVGLVFIGLLVVVFTGGKKDPPPKPVVTQPTRPEPRKSRPESTPTTPDPELMMDKDLVELAFVRDFLKCPEPRTKSATNIALDVKDFAAFGYRGVAGNVTAVGGLELNLRGGVADDTEDREYTGLSFSVDGETFDGAKLNRVRNGEKPSKWTWRLEDVTGTIHCRIYFIAKNAKGSVFVQRASTGSKKATKEFEGGADYELKYLDIKINDLKGDRVGVTLTADSTVSTANGPAYIAPTAIIFSEKPISVDAKTVQPEKPDEPELPKEEPQESPTDDEVKVNPDGTTQLKIGE